MPKVLVLLCFLNIAMQQCISPQLPVHRLIPAHCTIEVFPNYRWSQPHETPQ
jgi:hypothetical protein